MLWVGRGAGGEVLGRKALLGEGRLCSLLPVETKKILLSST